MAGSGFILADRDDTAFKAVMRQFIAKPSIQFAGGDALIFVRGRLEFATDVAASVDGIFNSLIYPASIARPVTENLTSASSGEEAQYIPCRGNGVIFKTFLTGSNAGTDTPPINGILGNANTDTTKVLVTAAGSANDYIGGTVYANGEQRTIVTDGVGGGVHTFTVNKPFTIAIATTHYVYAVPFSRGTRGVKLNGNTVHQGISCAIADNNGGKVNIEKVVLTDRVGYSHYALVSFQS